MNTYYIRQKKQLNLLFCEEGLKLMLNANNIFVVNNWEGLTELPPFWQEDSTNKARTAEGNIGMRRGNKGQKSTEEYRIKIKNNTNNNKKHIIQSSDVYLNTCCRRILSIYCVLEIFLILHCLPLKGMFFKLPFFFFFLRGVKTRR